MYCKLYLFLILVIIIKEKNLNIHKLNQPLHILHYGLPWRRSEETACSAEAPGPVPGSARSPGEGNSSPLWYSWLENPIDGGAWWTTVHGVTKSQTRVTTNFGILDLWVLETIKWI